MFSVAARGVQHFRRRPIGFEDVQHSHDTTVDALTHASIKAKRFYMTENRLWLSRTLKARTSRFRLPPKPVRERSGDDRPGAPFKCERGRRSFTRLALSQLRHRISGGVAAGGQLRVRHQALAPSVKTSTLPLRAPSV